MLNPNDDIALGYPAAMSAFKGVLNNSQMSQVIAYLKSASEVAVD
jgi:cytochrome c2